MNMEGEGIDDVREYFRKQLVTLGVLEPNEEEQQAMEAAAQQAQQPTPEQQYLMTQSEKAMAEVEKIRAEAQRIALEYNPEMIQYQQQAETAKMAAEVEKDRIRLETERLKARVAEIKALADLEIEREKAKAAIEAPRVETREMPAPVVVVDNAGNTSQFVKQSVDQMNMFLNEASSAIDRVSAQQANMTQTLEGVIDTMNKPKTAKVVIKKRADGSYVGEKTES
jgi:hypothetical protein